MSDDFDEEFELPDLDALETFEEEDKEQRKEQQLEEGGLEADELSRRVKVLEANIKTQGLREFYDLRKKWSGWIIFWISALITFNAILAVLVGAGALDFREYQWFISAVTVETFLQIVGMGYVAVKFLFSEPKVE
ncbi:hypothetical protein [Leisingera sp. JC1]|uniref:hypothetical protein n=1 Tax=Leisingera sp. JC1 TaxID=1855282 RepID=UPI0008037A4E|nr:hypothetical protein [Leisingera sp. JC1]OBY24202.1 hypothetical protein A9D60_24610 [Leisingera sp. JC1]